MLKNLYIENIAIIEAASLDFEAGFVVLSGETGAGKSIVIDAISGIMGARTSRDLIRTGYKKAVVTAEFVGIHSSTIAQAQGMGCQITGDTLVLQRELFADGRNTCRINGKAATTTMLKELCSGLITIHGQHDGTALLDEETHLDYLDAFLQDKNALAEYQRHYEELLSQNRRIKSLSMSIKQRQEQIDQLEGHIAVLEDLKPKEGEYYELGQVRLSLIGRQQMEQSLSGFLTAVDDDDGGGAVAVLSAALESLVRCDKYSVEISGIAERLAPIIDQLQELYSESHGIRDRLDYFEMSYEQVEERVELYESVAKRLATQPELLWQKYRELLGERDELDCSDQDIDTLKEGYKVKRQETVAAAALLTEQRTAAANRLKVEIEGQLNQLDMQNAGFMVEFLQVGPDGPQKFGKKGVDTVRFLLTANLGENYKPLSKVASGGELSRIMLAIKNVLSQADPVDTMIFDEVDTGISGRAANKVGEKLWNIAANKQVICVTHLPQIAAFADSHYLIEKSTEDNRTTTQITRLDGSGRAGEISRMTGGRSITDITLENAREMITNAEQYKKQTS